MCGRSIVVCNTELSARTTAAVVSQEVVHVLWSQSH